jgi:hypothetical protein
MILDIVIGSIVALIVAIMAIFVILIAVNAVLVLKLRSIIPPSPDATPPAAFHPRARQLERRAMIAQDHPEHTT